jgi:hypothetical protein
MPQPSVGHCQNISIAWLSALSNHSDRPFVGFANVARTVRDMDCLFAPVAWYGDKCNLGGLVSGKQFGALIGTSDRWSQIKRWHKKRSLTVAGG